MDGELRYSSALESLGTFRMAPFPKQGSRTKSAESPHFRRFVYALKKPAMGPFINDVVR